ncbi:MAG: WG repeat-containing protein, partial [Bacilli bacterium]|nr:WG repeat-containing protein [Bacilli bacterium]
MTIRKINILLFVVFVLLLTGCKSNTPSITGSDYIEVTIGTQLPDLLENITITNAELSDITIDSSSVDINTLGEYIITFSVNNGSKDPIIFEQTVRVVAYPISDIPMIFGVKDLTYIIGEDIPDYFDGLTAVDREYGNLTSKITGDFSNVKLDTPGQYLITYYVENIAGYQGSSTAYITVVLDDFEMNLPDEFIIVSQNGLFGIMTSSENILLPIEYDAISYVGDGMIQLIKNESEYYFDSESNEFYQYDYDLQSNFNDGLALVLNESSFYSYIHKDGTVAFPFVYSDASIFVDGKAIVSIGSSYGVIDTSGNEVIDLMYDDITLVFDNYFAKKVGDQYLVVDNEDDFIIELSSDEYSELWLENGDVLYVVEIDHTAALLDENFNVLIQSNHDQLIQYDDDNYIGIGTASYSIYNLKTDTQIDALGDYYTSKFEIYNTGTGYGRYDYELGYSVIPPIYQYLAVSPLNPNHYLAKNDVDMFGIITADNQIVYHFDAQHLTTSTSSGLYTFYDKDMYAGLLDADGKMVTATTYSAIGGFINGYAIVIDKVTGLYGYIDEKGTEVLSP